MTLEGLHVFGRGSSQICFLKENTGGGDQFWKVDTFVTMNLDCMAMMLGKVNETIFSQTVVKHGDFTMVESVKNHLNRNKSPSDKNNLNKCGL